MSKSLSDKLKTGIFLVGGLTGALAISGCLTEAMRQRMDERAEEYERNGPSISPYTGLAVFGNLNAGNAKTPREAAAWRASADFGSRQEQRQNAIDAAKAGKSDQTIVVNNYPQPQTPNREAPKPWPKAFVCNYLKDIDGDGISYPDEVIGEKRKFTTKESICFVRGIEGEGDFTFKVFDGQGKLLWTYNDSYNKKNGKYTISTFAPGAIKPGTYLGVWYNGEKADGSSQIEVVNE